MKHHEDGTISVVKGEQYSSWFCLLVPPAISAVWIFRLGLLSLFLDFDFLFVFLMLARWQFLMWRTRVFSKCHAGNSAHTQ